MYTAASLDSSVVDLGNKIVVHNICLSSYKFWLLSSPLRGWNLCFTAKQIQSSWITAPHNHYIMCAWVRMTASVCTFTKPAATTNHKLTALACFNALDWSLLKKKNNTMVSSVKAPHDHYIMCALAKVKAMDKQLPSQIPNSQLWSPSTHAWMEKIETPVAK